MAKLLAKINEPEILTAKTYFWSPGKNARDRRNNEERRLSEVEQFLIGLGFKEIENNGSSVCGKKNELEVHFSYSESCNNVYKHLSVTRDGKNSNITSLRKLYSK